MNIQGKIDQRIAKLQQVKELFADPGIFAFVKEILNEPDSAKPRPAAQKPAPNPAPKEKPAPIEKPVTAQAPTSKPSLRGLMTITADRCVRSMNQPFTAGELIEKMREAGYKFSGHPEVSIHAPLQKLIKDEVLEIVEQGAGRRATVYQRKKI
jgi:hypothetical protein